MLVKNQDALSFVSGLVDGSVACAITDPPHVGLEEHRARGTTTRLAKAWFSVIPDKQIIDIFAALYNKLARDAYLWVFADARLEHVLSHAMVGGKVGKRRRGAWVWWGSWVWVKKGKPGMGYHGRRSHEHIMLFEKGKPKLRDLGQRDVIECPQVTTKNLGGRKPYPTEKPLDVLSALLRCSTQEADLVVDPFCGSGSTGEAALRLGRRFSGCDTSAVAVAVARERLSAVCESYIVRP